MTTSLKTPFSNIWMGWPCHPYPSVPGEGSFHGQDWSHISLLPDTHSSGWLELTGHSLAIQTLQQLTNSLKWVLKNKYGIQHVIHVLDDFFMAARNKLDCLTSFSTWLRVFMSLKAQVVASKTIGPSWEIDFMGIRLDNIHMEAHLPQDKLVRINQLLNSFKNRRSACLVTVTDRDSPVFT